MTDNALRLVDRNGPLKQSQGTWNIRRIRPPQAWKLYFEAPFHTIVNQSLYKVILWFTLVYLTNLIFFACIYMVLPKQCNLGVTTFAQGWMFSVSVLSTIGFGANDIFFGSCPSGIFVITLESMMGILMGALAFGVLYQRFARGQARASTVAVSNFACVQKIRGNLYFMFQTCEMRKHQLNEAHVRCYAILHRSRNPYHSHHIHSIQSFPMRLQHPDDDLNAWLILALPSIIVHRIDAWSPLLPPEMRSRDPEHNPANDYRFPEPIQRAADEEVGNRDNRHRRNKGKLFDETSGSAITPMTNTEIDRILAYWNEVHLEVVVLIEGIDASSSYTVQMRQSFKASEIMFNHQFINCVDYENESGATVIDFNRFHRTVPMDSEAFSMSKED
ncbi:inward rectifier K channel (IRK-C) family protein [Thraustotheca clavata]|uniref:Inward rectifier K channel (IRK-C) family protein n=1 Tax=Thraustotheca clavata TaxID=74557 RepID=A0A1W0A4V7_9STRA|nr:inward rectifier K channel (IRK-C) family protein [Thraustotheca clavata]